MPHLQVMVFDNHPRKPLQQLLALAVLQIVDPLGMGSN